MISPCPWDSSFFGFPVAKIDAKRLDREKLEGELHSAKRDGIKLLYWQADPEISVSRRLLHTFGGALVDRKVTYTRSFEDVTITEMPNEDRNPSLRITEYPVAPASEPLLRLGVEAGVNSRFKADPRFPAALFQSLYRTWIDRSTRREIATTVLIAAGQNDVPIGTVTIDGAAKVGTIGLIAVARAARGRGIGRDLMTSAHRWMQERHILTSRVTTQQANRPACKLYQQCGYSVATVAHVYHFWPLRADD